MAGTLSTSTNYTGRTNDLLIVQNLVFKAETPAQVALAIGDSAQVVTGVQKAAQAFLVGLLTVQGSVANDPTAGSSFLSAVRGGLMTSEAAVQSYFATSAQQIITGLQLKWRAQLARKAIPAIPADELLVSATLLSFSVANDTLTLSVQITTAAGTARVVYYPIPVALV